MENRLSSNSIKNEDDESSFDQEIPNSKKFSFEKENIGYIARQIFKKIVQISSNESNYVSLYDECIKKNYLYVDLSFPANFLSLTKGLLDSKYSITQIEENNESHKKIVSFDNHLINLNTGKIENNHYTNKSLNNKSILSRQWSRIVWIRACEISSKPLLFPNCNKKDDIPNENLLLSSKIRQGILKNSQFLSVISALAEDSKKITKLFNSSICNNASVYEVKLWKDGFWNNYIIDDYLPCDFKKKTLCFSSCVYLNDIKNKSMKELKENHDQEYFWLPLLEKAFAKAFGSYYILESLTVEEALQSLTGSAVIQLDNSIEDLWLEIKQAFNNNYIILASSGDTSASRELLKEVGLLPYCSYNVLEAHELELDEMGNIEYLLKIRNYWGPIEWTGEWSNYSNHWEPELKESLNYELEKETSFWMNLKDFKHYFSKFHICKVDDKSKLSSIKISHYRNIQNLNKNKSLGNKYTSNEEQIQKQNYKLIRMIVENDNKVNTKNHFSTQSNENNSKNSSMRSKSINSESNESGNNDLSQISLIQKHSSNYIIKNQNYSPFLSRFILCKINKKSSIFNPKEDLIYLEGTMGKDICISKDYNLTPGEYLIYSEVDFEFSSELSSFSYAINCYSRKNISFFLIETSQFPNILNEIYISAANQNESKHFFDIEGAPNCFKSTKVTPEGYAFIYFKNNEEEATLVEDVKYTKFEGIKLLSPYSGTSYFVQVPSFTEKIILMKRITVGEITLNYSFQ